MAPGTSSNTISGGTVIYSSYISNAELSLIGDLLDNIHLGVSISGALDQIVVAVMPIIGGGTGYYGSLTFQELL